MKKTLASMLLTATVLMGAAPKADAAIFVLSSIWLQDYHSQRINNLTVAAMIPPFIVFGYGGMTGNLPLSAMGGLVFLDDNQKIEDSIAMKLSQDFPFIENKSLIKQIANDLKQNLTDEGDHQSASLSEEQINHYIERSESEGREADYMKLVLGPKQ